MYNALLYILLFASLILFFVTLFYAYKKRITDKSVKKQLNENIVKELIAEDDKELLNDYLNSVVAETSRIDIKGIYSRPGSSREAIHFPIEHIYTPLKTRQIRAQANLHKKEDSICKEGFLTDLLQKYRHMLIIGEPGGGKTTFLRLIACVLAKNALGQSMVGQKHYSDISLGESTSIPIFIRLSTIAEVMKYSHANVGSGTSWNKLILAMENIFGHEKSAMLQKLMDRGKCALLLDGLDEIPEDNLRNRIVEVVNSMIYHWGNNIIVISSRPYGYKDIADLEKIVTFHIDDFGEKEIIEFLDRWGRGLYPDENERKRDRYMPKLKKAIIESLPIRKLARNPVMLTCLCVVHWNERRLPEGKAELLAAVLRWLQNAREENRVKRGYSSAFVEECFKTLALAMTADKDGKKVNVDISWAAEQLATPFRDILNVVDENRVRREGMKLLEMEMLDSCIIQKLSGGQLRFWHLNFQEHYTARALVDRSDEAWWKIIESNFFDKQWMEVLDHLTGCMTWTGWYRLNLLIEKILGTIKKYDLNSAALSFSGLGRVMKILEAYDYKPPERLGLMEALDRVMAIFNIEGAFEVKIDQRLDAAEALALIGDPRFNSLYTEMIPIPKEPEVLLGKYPVTVQEYLRFVENGGYKDPIYWGEEWSIIKKEGWFEPVNWEEQIEHLNHPVTGISWYEAKAYCRWLATQTDLPFRLPKSEEWLKVATHPKGDYPWGDDEPNSELLNFDGKLGRPTPVGLYPAGAAINGHLDLSGNVWEWSLDKAGEAGLSIMILGGSWNSKKYNCRSTSEFESIPEHRDCDTGFRLAKSVSIGY